MTTLVMMAILLFGIMGYRLLPVSDLPNVDFPTISVTAALPGASPETMASAVATPLEKQFSTIAGLDSMTSTSAPGHHARSRCSSTWTATSTPRRRTCSRRSPGALRQLPPDMPTPPSYQKVNPADQPVLYLALTSPTLPLSDGGRVRRDADGPAHLDGQRRGAGAGLRLAEVRRARAGRPQHARPHAASASTRCTQAVQQRQREPADRHAVRHAAGVHRRRPTASSSTPPPTGR